MVLMWVVFYGELLALLRSQDAGEKTSAGGEGRLPGRGLRGRPLQYGEHLPNYTVMRLYVFIHHMTICCLLYGLQTPEWALL